MICATRCKPRWKKKGIRLVLDTVFTRCETRGDKIRALTFAGETIAVDEVMLAIGRKPNIQGLGLEAAGVATKHSGHIEVDRYSRTSVPNIYAIGDVTGRMELTPVALHEAMCFATTVFGGT